MYTYVMRFFVSVSCSWTENADCCYSPGGWEYKGNKDYRFNEKSDDKAIRFAKSYVEKHNLKRNVCQILGSDYRETGRDTDWEISAKVTEVERVGLFKPSVFRKLKPKKIFQRR
jgi:hypothetical protein